MKSLTTFQKLGPAKAAAKALAKRHRTTVFVCETPTHYRLGTHAPKFGRYWVYNRNGFQQLL